MMNIEWHCKFFNQLTVYELYKIIQLRNEVFVVEQQCIFQDADDKDFLSYHLFGMNAKEELCAYCRILPPGVAFEEASIGRVAVSPRYRKQGLGVQLMKLAIKHTQQLFPNTSIQIGAQLYLKRFYESLQFIAVGNVYLEDGIEHIHMVLSCR